jgi:hypothetical protein
MRSLATTMVMLIAVEVATAAMPYPKPKDATCASGYTTSGAYCVPARADSKPAIPKVGSCPSGWSSEAHACVKMR